MFSIFVKLCLFFALISCGNKMSITTEKTPKKFLKATCKNGLLKKSDCTDSEANDGSDAENLDTTAPTAAGAAVSFALNSTDKNLIDVAWLAAGTDAESGVAKQELLLFGGDNSTCSGNANATVVVGKTATSAQFNRFSADARGIVRFRIRVTDEAGNFSDSPCSGSIQLRNGVMRFDGVSNSEMLSVSQAHGDFNDDGIDDLATAPTTSATTGYIAILFGGSDLANQEIFYVPGDNGSFQLGGSISAQDMNGDGITDIIVSNYAADPGARADAGSVFVLLGRLTWTSAATFTAAGGYRYDGLLAGDKFNVNQFLDMNKDGTIDAVGQIESAPGVGGGALRGVLFLLFGSDPLPASNTIDVAGRRYVGNADNDKLGYLTQWVDVTGDGYLDWTSAQGNYNSNRGALFVVEARASFPASGAFTATGAGKTYTGDNANDAFADAAYFCAFKDMNLDAKMDFICFSYLADPGGRSNAGSIYVLPGADPMPASGAISARGKRYDGITAGDSVWYSLVEDTNGDTYRDIIACSDTAQSNKGQVYIIPVTATFPNSNSIDNVASIIYTGANTDDRLCAGRMAFADVTGDSHKDLLVGAHGDDVGGLTDAGSIFVFKGNPLPATGVAQTQAFREYNGDTAGHRIGQFSTAGVADVTGDGIADIINAGHVWAYSDYNGMNDCGSVDIIPGSLSLPNSGSWTSAGGKTYHGTAGSKFGNIIELLLYGVGQSPYKDVNGDGILDILVSAPDGFADRLYFVFGGTSLANSGLIDTAGRHYTSGLVTSADFQQVDLTGDGKKEFVVCPVLAGDGISIYEPKANMPASGTFLATAPLALSESGTWRCASGDFNNDGLQDLFVKNGTGSWMVKGNASFSQLKFSKITDPTWDDIGDQAFNNLEQFPIFDATGDGKLDLFQTNYQTDTGGITDHGTISVLPYPYWLPQ